MIDWPTVSTSLSRSRVIRVPGWPAQSLAAHRPRNERLTIRRLTTRPSPNWVTASVFSLITVALLVQVAFPALQLQVSTPELAWGSSLISSVMWLFGALVLLLFPVDENRNRLRWLALVCVTHGISSVVFDVMIPLIDNHYALTSSMYLSIGVRTLTMVLLCVGFVPASPPQPSRIAVAWAALSLGIFWVIAVAGRAVLQGLSSVVTWDATMASDANMLVPRSIWHWLVSAMPLVITLAACAGFIRHRPNCGWPWWLSLAMLFIVGSQVHSMLPGSYIPAFTTSRLLVLCWASMIAIGGVIQIQRMLLERNQLLIAERAYSRRLHDLAALKADFTSMAAHELGGPVAAIRSLATIADLDDIGRDDRSRALKGIQAEAKMLGTLVRDVQSASGIERDEFAVSPRPFSAAVLLGDAARFAQARFADEHHLVVQGVLEDQVRADPDRIRQVLSNLLTNAAKYSPTGTTIRLVMSRIANSRILIEVIDEGYGIPEDEMSRIVEKFGRGRDAEARQVPGLGLGLYVTRRILRAHGTDLSLRSSPGEGTTASFELEVVG